MKFVFNPVAGNLDEVSDQISDIFGLQTALDGKAALSHTHSESDVTNLISDLAGKEPVIAAGTTSQYWRGDKTWQTLNKAAVGLGNVLNVAQEPAISTGTSSQYWRGDKSWRALASDAVTSLAGTSNQVTASASVGSIILSLPQNIHTGATPQFGGMGINIAQASVGALFGIQQSATKDGFRLGDISGGNYYKFGRSTSDGHLYVEGTQVGFTGFHLVGGNLYLDANAGINLSGTGGLHINDSGIGSPHSEVLVAYGGFRLGSAGGGTGDDYTITRNSGNGVLEFYGSQGTFNGYLFKGADKSAMLTLSNLGNVVVGSAALATNATDGFLYIPTCAGTPTGTPTSYTGRVAQVYDTTNNKLYVYNGAWKSVTLT